MNTDDLRSMWQDAHTENQENKYDRININKFIDKSHSQIMTKVIADVKWGIFTSSMGLVLFASLWIYAYGYLKIHLHTYAVIPFLGGSIFLMIQMTTSIFRFNILTHQTEGHTIKDSLLFFRRKVNRMKMIDFLSYLIFFYLLAIWIIYLYLKDIGGIKNLATGNEIQPLIMILILLSLMLPWLIKYLYNQRYKTLFTNLNRSANDLDEA
jgi:hypothetical protein